MRTIFEDKVLYELISMELFRGKKLEIRHFISILKRANIAEGSISKLRKDIINDTKEKQIENKTVNTEKKKSNSETEDDKKSEIPTEHIERKTENIAQEKTEESLAQNKSELPKKLGILAKRVRENKIDKRLG